MGAGVAGSLGLGGGRGTRGEGSDTILASELVCTPTCLLKANEL